MKFTTIPWEDGLKDRLKDHEYAFKLLDKISKEHVQLLKENNELERRLKRACEVLRKAAYSDDETTLSLPFAIIADELERPLEQK